MGYDELLMTLEKNACSERKTILKRAKEASEKIIRDAEMDAKRYMDDYMRKVSVSVEADRARRLNVARKKAKEILLRTEHKIISAVFEEAERRFGSLQDYPDILRQLFEETFEAAEKEIGEGRCQLLAGRNDVRCLREICEQKRLNVELIPTDSVSFGVVVSKTDGKIRLINTLHSRLQKMKIKIKPLLREKLFSGVEYGSGLS